MTPTHTDIPASPEAFVQAAQQQGLVPAGAQVPATAQRPWPVVLLTALGAWLSALPLMAFVALLLEDVVPEQLAPYLAGVALLTAAVVVLRAREVPVFVEQLAIPALFTGAGALGYGLLRDLPPTLGGALLFLLTLGTGALLPRPWLRVLLGATAAPLCMVTLGTPDAWHRIASFPAVLWLVVHAVFALWVLATWLQPRGLGTPRGAQAALLVEQLGAGWLQATLTALAISSGSTFLLGGATGSGVAADIARELGGSIGADPTRWGWREAGSVLLALAAAGVLARAWRVLRQPPLVGAAVVLAGLCALLPFLGAVLLALALVVRRQQWHIAGAAGCAAAWIVGSFYYQLAWPLATKAAWMVLAGALLAGLTWWAWRREAALSGSDRSPTTRPTGRARLGTALLLASAAATLVVANLGIQQKERLIAQGQPLFVALAPVDPRSLMQGDYMRLRFTLPPDLPEDTGAFGGGQRPHLVAKRDERGVATLSGPHVAGSALAQDELLIELTPKNGEWVLVSDAWFFREGEATRFEEAKFGEFRVSPDGQALLVGMADAQLRRIAP